MRKIKSGFVFIELLLVVLFISILAVIATPSYSDYIERAKSAEALAMAKPVQQHIAEYYAWHGRFPENNAVLALPDPAQWRGNNVQKLTVEHGKIKLQLATVSSELVLLFTPEIDASETRITHWKCQLAEHLQEEMISFVPSYCR